MLVRSTHLDDLKLDQVHLGGLSMGAGIAINICLRYPERVKALILHRPAWLDQADPSNLLLLKQAVPFIGKSTGGAEFRKLDSFLKIEKELPSAAKSILGVFSKTQQSSLSKVIEQLVGDRPFIDLDLLGKIEQPCLIIANEDDPLHPFWMAEEICKKIQNSELKKVTSRYIDNELHQQEVRNLITTFIKENY